jgi:hypothetical protein
MAATPTTMDLVSLPEDICLVPFADAIDLRMAGDAGTALEATRKVAASLAGVGWTPRVSQRFAKETFRAHDRTIRHVGH